MSQPMNREQRRMLKKQGQEVTPDGEVISNKTSSSGGSGSGSGGRVTKKGGAGDSDGKKNRRDAAVEVEERTSPVQFVGEVRSELRKVNWPTRAEVINYSIVVLVTVIILTIFIGVLDWLFATFVLELFEPRQ